MCGVNEDAPVGMREEFEGKVRSPLDGIATGQEVILEGDFNSRVGRKTDSQVICQNGET